MIKMGREKPTVEYINSIRTKNTMKIWIATEERERERERGRKKRERERERDRNREREAEVERNI